MFLSSKLHYLNSRLSCTQSIKPTECLAWCDSSSLFSPKSCEYSTKKTVEDALEGYSQLKKTGERYDLLGLALHAWFASRDNHELNHLKALSRKDRPRITNELPPNDLVFARKFAMAIEDDLRPMIDILRDGDFALEMALEEGECDRERDELMRDKFDLDESFTNQFVRTYEWAFERSLNFQTQNVPKKLQIFGKAVLVPLIDLIPNGPVRANCVVAVPSRECDENALKSWANDVGFEFDAKHGKPACLLLATKNITNGAHLLRDCSGRFVGTTGGADGKKLPNAPNFKPKVMKENGVA